MYEGHIKLFRKLRKAPYYQDSQYVHLWVHLLLSVNWYQKRLKLDKSDKFIDLMPGQVLTSRDKLAEQTGIHRSKVDRILKAFEREQQIEQQTCSKYRVISILNWSDYQFTEQQDEHEMSNNRAASEPQVSTKKKVKKTEECKEGKEKRLLPLCAAWHGFKDMRAKIKKPLTDKGMQLAVMKLASLQSSGNDPVEVLNQSTFNSWQGLFPVKEQTNGRQGTTGSAAHPRAEKGKPSGPVIDGTPKPAGYYAGDFPDRSDEW